MYFFPFAVKTSYYRLARVYHPDCCINESKKIEAQKIFPILHHAYSVLADSETKKAYDEGGSISLHANTTIAAKWIPYIRTVDSDDIDSARSKYQGTIAEEQDIIREFITGKGSMTHLFNTIPFMRYEDELRIIDIVKNQIDKGNIPKIPFRKMRNAK